MRSSQRHRMPAGLLAALALASPVGAQTTLALLAAQDAENGDHFGSSVALDGGTLVVGMPDDFVPGGSASGSVRVFECLADSWVPVAELRASDGGDLDRFGCSVAISGERILVGATRALAGGEHRGAAYVFERGPGGWPATETAKLVASDGQAFDEFGVAVAIDGATALVGSWLEDGACVANPFCESGAAYLFERGPQGWPATETVALRASDGASQGFFGACLGLEGERVVVGAPRAQGAASHSGAAYVYERGPLGWPSSETYRLTAADGISDQAFGSAVAIDGDLVLVGAPDDHHLGFESGAAYLFELSSIGWSGTQLAKLIPGEYAEGLHLGTSVALAEGRAVAGTRATGQPGLVLVYEPGYAGWGPQPVQKINGMVSGVLEGFGAQVAASGDRLLVGAPDAVTLVNSGAGLASLFALSISAAPGLVSLSFGGVQNIELNAGEENGGRLYLMLGTSSGTWPGTDEWGVHVPLVSDDWFGYTLQNPGTDLIGNAFGVLDPLGHAQVSINVVGGLAGAGWVGGVLYHAYIVFDVGGPSLIRYVSDPVALALVN